ncbi:LysR family transcriptional regulator [Salipaludibacillus neizhouensis]|uniref:LysR family transcriptional regulator n=1 Tax=Salipaludibacillus neizhouensis TaxID=885475 RepID=A0A3A9K303_9BACI|nr:LysR family transcriptional regulator [Salipaludibacillus neizhouensis]RKL64852.1 LysR family transcriptional regulator [Salipaludibacillus neizhouensis]
MELTDLKIFLTVADERNVSKSAVILGYVQSNITNRIKKLETELGSPLFYRHPKGVTLTDKGEIFYDHAASIMKRAEEAIAAVQESEDFSGTLSIGMVETLASHKFMSILSDFQQNYANVSLSLNTGTSPKLLEQVQKYQLDAAFVTGEVKATNVSVEYTIEDIVSVITSKSKQEEDYSRNWVVFPEGCPFRKTLNQWMERRGMKPINFIEVTTLDTLLNCVKSGLASAVLPMSVISEDQKNEYSMTLLPVEHRYMNTHLVRPKDLSMNKVLSSFIEKIQQNEL